MAVPTATLSANQSGPKPESGGELSEAWDISGNTSSDGDSVAITSRFITRPTRVEGAASWSISGRVVTVTLLAAQAASEVTSIRIFGYA